MRMAANDSHQTRGRGGMTCREARWSVGNRAMFMMSEEQVRRNQRDQTLVRQAREALTQQT